MSITTIHYKKNICLLILATCFARCQPPKNEVPESFQIHPDFNLQLVASEPLVFDPVDMQFDENGRAFVLEMPGYPMGDVESRLIELVDSNVDGVYDKRVVMEDKLGVATSFLPYKEGFLVASPPHLLWIGDTDGDGKIDDRQILMDGFAVRNLQHNFNGLTYGIDNWIYAANGGNSGKPFFANQPEDAIDLREFDLRINLEQKQLMRIGRSSGGFKLTFNDWGHVFETHNTQHVYHLTFEDRYLEGLPVSPSTALRNISDHEENGLARIYPIGEQESRINHPEQSGYFSGGCGITYHGGGGFPNGFNGLYVADCVLNLVHLDMLNDSGSTFKASRKQDNVEFLASSDRAFRPVNLCVGPDGALYVLDMHRDVIEHPEWIPDEMEAKMDLNAGKDKGRIYKITPERNWSPEKRNLKTNDPEKLAQAFESANQWTRTTAQRLLVTEDVFAAVPFLKEQLNSKNPLTRLHSMWTLEGLTELESSLLKKVLYDPSPGVRENAIKIAELRLNNEIELVDGILALTKDQSARVRMQAALSLGTLTENNYAKYRAAIGEAMFEMMSDTASNDTWTTIAVATALQHQALAFLTNLVEVKNGNLTAIDLRVLMILSEKIGRDGNADDLETLIRTMHANSLRGDLKTKVLEALNRGWEKGSNRKLESVDAKKLAVAMASLDFGTDVALTRAVGHLSQALGLPVSEKIKGLVKVASVSVFDHKLPTQARIDHLQLLALDNFNNRKEILFKVLDSKQPLALQKEALSQLGKEQDPDVGKRLLELWPGLTPEARDIAANILLYKSFNHNQLVTAIENNTVKLGELNLNLERRRVLLFSKDENIKKRAAALFSDAGVVTRKDAIEKMRPALSLQGNVSAGEAVFKAQCALCHKYGDIGKDVGPVLTEINRKSKELLIHDILDPNAAVNTQYLAYRVKTKDGNILTGLVFHETDAEIGLRMMGGDEMTIPKTNIEEFSSLGTSLMFEGLESNMTLQEMADLLAFLQQSNTNL